MRHQLQLCVCSGTDDLFKVKEKLTEAGMAVRWRDIGLALGLRGHQLDLIQSDHRTSEDCLTAMATEWLRQTYDVTECVEPSVRQSQTQLVGKAPQQPMQSSTTGHLPGQLQCI